MTRTFDYQIQLIGLVEGLDDDGFPVNEIRPKTPIFANRLSVRSNEYWQAKQSGVDLSCVFEVHSFEYEGEERMLYENIEYEIARTYNKGELTELICHRKGDDHGT
ncbi:phage head closure protein [Sporosarcina highlanderae]|uniref:Phage head closure protein n=1 Tax=Sporosarcina highlanderae TaxID=3035916 RepID=A0ABT8JVC3_9BACL|nr:phage head closure protein [Sporosarcina highlanderae]MDN4609125.1 phage head closure protein [Sporosarcina highlanderae]